jgi:hypothetical protein
MADRSAVCSLSCCVSQAGIDNMDLTITKCMDDTDVPDVRLKITTYQKPPHHQYMYIPYHSFHGRGVFKGFIKDELHRYAVTNTLPAVSGFSAHEVLVFAALA